MKKCLIISYHFYPNGTVGAKRYNLFSYYLDKKLRILDILTVKEKYMPEKDEELIFGGKIYRTGMFPRYMYNGNKVIKAINNRIIVNLLPIDFYSTWIVPALFKGMRIVKKDQIDTIIVTGPPFSPFLTAYLICMFFNINLIIDYQDPWVLDVDRNESSFKKKYNWILERIILKKAKKIIFNTQQAKDEYLKLNLKFNINKKSFVILNPYIDNNIKPRYLEKNKKVILYAGNFYGKRRLKYLFEPILKLYNYNELISKISIHIFGKIHDEDKKLINKMNLTEMIHEHERINYNLLASYMKGVDILYLSQGEDHGLSVPYKLIDYLTMKKPIIAVTSLNSSTYSFMQEVDCGIVANIEDPDSIYKALKEVLIDERIFSYKGIEKYSLDNIGDVFYKIICSQD